MRMGIVLVTHDVEEVRNHHDIDIDTPADNVKQGVQGKQPIIEPPPVSQLKQSTKEHQPSKMYTAYEYIMITDAGEPESYLEVQEDEHKRQWLKEMHDKMESMQKNYTYDLVKHQRVRKL